MLCVPCVLGPVLLFLWGIIKIMINWFWRAPVENPENQSNDNDQDFPLFSSCPCIKKNIKSLDNQADKTNKSETLLKEPLETSNTEKKNN
ncbi:Uncharacterized protein FWK35_00038602 [Aphis craccivora]|uniref:Uncharacterized protein n=1 Tax=Aphis craccivora TaxID=307492 RepID=A0A6G0W4N3_APHCR|nr:Uncharacterized protein FWK35_00038602 [Aphis craccivora]